MKQENNKKILGITLVGVITLIVVVVGATYAYFQATSSGEGNIDTNVGTSTTDNLSFAFGEEIHINATEENFAQGMPSLSDSTTGTALLRPNNYTNQATATYNIYLIIENNNFVYTTENQTPEILLKVTSPTGVELENITGLVHTADGFDITTRTGGFLIISDYEITADQVEEIQQWNIEVTFVNLDSDQQANTEKNLTAKLYMTQEQMSSYELIEINNINTSTTYNSVTAILDITDGSASVSKYYYGIEETNGATAYINDNNKLQQLSNTLANAETVEYIESDSASYTFSNLEPNKEYTVYSYVVDTNNIKSNVYETTVTTGEYNLAMVDDVSHSVTLNSISLTVTASNGSNEIVNYMYSKDNGATWETTTSNTYTFDNLTDSTTYQIKVKVKDSAGVESTEYYEEITTEIYILPVVASVDAEATYNSITLTPTGTNGTNNIDHYLYSIDDGAYQESNVFSNLNDNTEYTINVKAVDTEDRESNPYEIKVTTDEYILPTISNVTASSTSDSITLNVTASGGTGSIVTYHYSKDDGLNYVESTSPNYTFNDLTSDATFYLKVYVTDSNGRTSGEYSTSVATEPDIVYLADYIKNTVYTGDGNNGLYYHDGSGSYTNAAQEAGDNSYRYAGADPNNYVCFGSDAETCPNDNLYRIIGVFGNQVKLIKHDYANSNMLGTNGDYYGAYTSEWSSSSYYKGNQSQSAIPIYYWNRNGSNTWSASQLNTVNLNTNYINCLNGINSKLSAMIETTTWKVGGGSYSYLRHSAVKTAYNYEVGNNSSSTTYNAKIGLMYVSDYGYAASPANWTTTLSNYANDTNRNNNWMFMGLSEWTISRGSDFTNSVLGVHSEGLVNDLSVGNGLGVRPSFYLKSNVAITGGTGTSSDPYRLALN